MARGVADQMQSDLADIAMQRIRSLRLDPNSEPAAELSEAMKAYDAKRAEMERLSNTLETIVAEQAQPAAEAAAEQARSLPGIGLTAHMMGEHNGQPCTVLLRAGLLQLGPQIVPGENSDPADDHSPGFHIGVAPAGFQTYAEQFLASESPAEMLAFLEESDARESQQLPPWEACMMSERERQAAREAQAQTGCTAKICSPGQMVLEAAGHDHIAAALSSRWCAGTHAMARTHATRAWIEAP